MTVVLAAAAAWLFAVGTYLVLQRTLTRVIIGLGLLSHGGNVLLMASDRRGLPPIIGRGDSRRFSDPLPDAFALTAIVITFGVTAFLLALAYRSWILTRNDDVQDDLEDRLIARLDRGDEQRSDEEVSDEEADRAAARRQERS